MCIRDSDNADANQVVDRIEFFHPEALPAGVQVDLVLANLLAGVLVQLAAEFGRRVKPGGRLLLSGILEQHADVVQAAFSSDFRVDARTVREDWVLLESVRR